jgi:hypothetical protein
MDSRSSSMNPRLVGVMAMDVGVYPIPWFGCDSWDMVDIWLSITFSEIKIGLLRLLITRMYSWYFCLLRISIAEILLLSYKICLFLRARVVVRRSSLLVSVFFSYLSSNS